MVATTAEESRGLDAEVADALTVVIHHAEAILLQDSLILFFDFLKIYTEIVLSFYLGHSSPTPNRVQAM